MLVEPRPYGVPGGQPGLPVGPFGRVAQQERPALALTGADAPGAAEHLLDHRHLDPVQSEGRVADDHRPGGQVDAGRHRGGGHQDLRLAGAERLLGLPLVRPVPVVQPYARLGAQPFHLVGVVGVHAGDGHAPVGGQRERRGPHPAFAAAEDEDTAAVPGDLAGDADGGLGADGGAARPVGLVDRGQEGQLPGEPGGPPDGADEPGAEPVRDLVRVGDRRGQADDAGGRAVVPYAGEQRLQDRAARRVAEQMDLVDDQAADLGERVPQRAGAADRLELLGGGDPDVGRPDQLRVHRRLTGQAHHPQSPVTPQSQFAVEFVGERALRHQPGCLAAAGVRLQGGDHPDRGLSRARRRHDDEVPGALQHRRDGGGLHRVERRVRQHGGPGVGHEAADGHVRLDGVVRQLLQRVPLGGEGVPGRRRPATGGRGGAVRTGRDQFGAVAGVPDRADLPGLLPVPADPVRNAPFLQPRPQGPVRRALGKDHPHVIGRRERRVGRAPRGVGGRAPQQRARFGRVGRLQVPRPHRSGDHAHPEGRLPRDAHDRGHGDARPVRAAHGRRGRRAGPGRPHGLAGHLSGQLVVPLHPEIGEGERGGTGGADERRVLVGAPLGLVRLAQGVEFAAALGAAASHCLLVAPPRLREPLRELPPARPPPLPHQVGDRSPHAGLVTTHAPTVASRDHRAPGDREVLPLEHPVAARPRTGPEPPQGRRRRAAGRPRSHQAQLPQHAPPGRREVRGQ